MKNKYVTQQQTTTTNLQAPDLGQTHAYMAGLNMLEGSPLYLGQWCNSTTYDRTIMNIG